MKKFMSGLIIGALLMASTNAFAAVGETVQAVFAKFNYIVNGETQTLDEPVLVHNGNSYLRTTQIMNMLGYDVTYKSDTRTIEFNKPSEVVQPAPIVEEQTPLPQEEKQSEVITEPTSGNGTTTVNEPATETPVVEETEPDNTVACQGIRDSYGSSIAALSYQGLTQGQYNLQKHYLEYDRDQALASAGCN